MAATCVIQTRIDENTKARAERAFRRRGMTMSEGLRLSLEHEIGAEKSPLEELNTIFLDSDRIGEASGVAEPMIDEIVAFCNNIKRERAERATAFPW